MIHESLGNSKDVTATAIARQAGYALYMAQLPIVRCDSITAARGWLEAQWQHDCSMAAEWGVKPTGVHPNRLTDADVEGAIVQSDHMCEVEFWEDRRRGY